jgi:hypothetical protein
LNVTFVGTPGLPNETLEWMRAEVRDPHCYIVSVASDDRRR